MTKTAELIRRLDGFTGEAALYKLSEPIGYDWDYETDEHAETTSYVVVSATIAMFTGAETYIFPANEDGEVVSYGELPGPIVAVSIMKRHCEAPATN